MRKLFTPPEGGTGPKFDWKKIVAAATSAVDGPAHGHSGLRRIDTFGANPGGLHMYLHAPAGLPKGAPLVVVLHGCGQSAAAYDRGAGWSALADKLGFAVLAPEQDRANNPNGCFSWFQPEDTTRGRGEAASIRQMIDEAVRAYGLDRGRIFITGLSAGGAMTSVMLAAYPEVFAGGAIIAGLPYGAASTVQEALSSMRAPPALSSRAWGDRVRGASPHRGPWPRISIWHGDADHTVSAANAEAILAQWADVHGVSSAAPSRDRVDGYPRKLWRNLDGEPVIESYSITGMGHGTPIAPGAEPGGCGAPAPFILSAGISSSHRIAQFWGLAEAGDARASDLAPTALVARATQRQDDVAYLDFQPVPEPAKPSGRLDPQAVITKALRAAGLMM